MKTVVHVVERFYGGVRDSIITIIRNYVGEYEPVVVCGTRNFVMLPEDLRDKVRIEHFPEVPSTKLNSILKSVRALIKIIDQVQPDVIHLHSSLAGAIGRMACALRRRRCFYTPHCYAFLQVNYSKTSRAIFWLIEFALAPFGQTIACGLEEYKLGNRFIGPRTVVENGVSIEFLDLERDWNLKRHGDSLKWIMVGRECPQKDHTALFALASGPAFRDDQFVWVTGGEAPPTSPLANLSILGRVEPTELAEIMASCDVYINTSRWEGLSRSVIEALALGMPLLLRDCPGNREVNFRGALSRIFRSKEDIQQVAEEFRQSLNSGDRFKAHRANRLLAQKFYNGAKTSARIRSLYDAEIFSNINFNAAR